VSANDNNDRRRIFNTYGGAMSEALRMACQLSPVGMARPCLFVANVYMPRNGERAFEAENLVEGWGVREIPAAELSRRIEGGMRLEIEKQLESACKHEALAEAAEARGDANFARIHREYERSFHDMARTLQTKLTMRAVG
jgi:hypothetical protein